MGFRSMVMGVLSFVGLTCKRDAYDAAIEYLRSLNDSEFRSRICDAWCSPDDTKGGCLFAFAHSDGCGDTDHPTKTYGCLTQIRSFSHEYVAANDALTLEIAQDERIPTRPLGITKENLEVFAEWQRRLDKELGRPAPSIEKMVAVKA